MLNLNLTYEGHTMHETLDLAKFDLHSCYRTGCRKVGRYSARGVSQGMYISFTSAKVTKAEPTLALKPRETRHQKSMCTCPPRNILTKSTFIPILFVLFWGNDPYLSGI